MERNNGNQTPGTVTIVTSQTVDDLMLL